MALVALDVANEVALLPLLSGTTPLLGRDAGLDADDVVPLVDDPPPMADDAREPALEAPRDVADELRWLWLPEDVATAPDEDEAPPCTGRHAPAAPHSWPAGQMFSTLQGVRHTLATHAWPPVQSAADSHA